MKNFLTKSLLLCFLALSSPYVFAQHNADAVDSVLDNMIEDISVFVNDQAPDVKRGLLTELSGSFLPSVVNSSLFNAGRDNLYGRIKHRTYNGGNICIACNKTPVFWLQGHSYGTQLDKDENTLAAFKAASYGAQAGWDIFNKQNFVAGVYLGYTGSDLKQGFDKAQADAYSLGAYGGFFGERWDLKTSLTLGLHNFETKRDLVSFGGSIAEADFDVYTAVIDGVLGYNAPITRSLNLRPFIGLQGAMAHNESFKESGAMGVDLAVESGNNFRASAFAGLRLAPRSHAKFDWYADVHAELLLAGAHGVLDAQFVDVPGSIEIWGTKQSRLGAGATLGAEYEVFRNVGLYANAGANLFDGAHNYWGNLGLNFKFCAGKKPCAPKQTPRVAPKADNSYFAFDKFALTESARQPLANFALELSKEQYNKLSIVGHTDGVGSEEYNQRLSEARANAVKDYLVERGVEAGKIESLGKGKSAPLATNATSEGRAQNRRVEITVK